MGRIGCLHVRNIKYLGYHRFREASHLSSDGSLDMYAIMKAVHDTCPDTYIRPDHGRMIWTRRAARAMAVRPRPGRHVSQRPVGSHLPQRRLRHKEENTMKMCLSALQSPAAWEALGSPCPALTWRPWPAHQGPSLWVHFGAGNIFRGFIAALQQSLLNQGLATGALSPRKPSTMTLWTAFTRPLTT